MHRNEIKKNIFAGCAMLFFLSALSGCSHNPQNYTDNGITITLDNSFEKQSSSTYDLYLESDDIIFSAKEETSSEIEYSGYEINSLKDYALEIISLNGVAESSLKEEGNHFYFKNTLTKSGASYTYTHYLFKNNDSYWICEFVCKTKAYNQYKDSISEWANTITFDNQ